MILWRDRSPSAGNRLRARLAAAQGTCLIALGALVGCTGEPPRATIAESSLERASPPAHDAPPRTRVELSGRTRDAIAEVRLGDSIAYVAPDLRLVLLSPDGERELAAEVGGSPVTDGEILVWAEPRDIGAELRVLRPGAEPSTLAALPGVLAPLAITSGHIALVGAANGGVAGLWMIATQDGAEPVCVTNCALRAGRPWGSEYVPPPGDGVSITIDGDRITYVDAEGTRRDATLPAAALPTAALPAAALPRDAR